MMQEIEIQRLREQVAQLREEVENIRRDIYNAPPNDEAGDEETPTPNARAVVPVPPPEPAWYAPRRLNRAMNWMYDIAQAHAIVRNFGWAAIDGARFAGFVGGVALAAAKATPAAVAKAKGAAAVLGAAAAANPIGAGVAAVVVVAAAERATRYEDDDGVTKHKCVIM